MNRKLKIVALMSLAVFSFMAVATSTFAWFAQLPDIAFGSGTGKINVTAGSETSYYERGSGDTIDDPYVISNRNHLYNLAWLQYMGRYNSPNIQQKYFKLKNDIDMSGLALPPIGTDNYPFLGHFDGNNKTISNLIVSNDDPTSATNDFGVTKPSNSNLVGTTQPKIVGFFGVVGQSPTISNITYDTSIVSISNLNLNNLTVKSQTSQTLIGLAAGYVDGAMSGVKISGTATLDLGTNAKTAISNDITAKLTDYALVGYTKDKDVAASEYSQELSEYFNSKDPAGEGYDAGWGGSISSKEYNTWIYNLKANNQVSGSNSSSSPYSKEVSGQGGYSLKYTTSSTSNPSSNQVINRLRDGNYIPLKFTDDNKTSTSISNTGYIVGANIGTGVNGSPKVASYKLQNIGNSLGNTTYGTNNYYDTYNSSTAATFTDSKLEVLTYSFSSSSWVRIKDTHNANNSTTNTIMSNYTKSDDTTPSKLGFQKYVNSRNSLGEALSSGNQVHGIKFDTQLSKNEVLTVPQNTIRLNGSLISSSYQLPKGSVDFFLKEEGLVNFFAGAYNSGGYSNDKLKVLEFFSLYKIDRSGGTVSSITAISKIYQNKYWDSTKPSNATSNPKYFYQYYGGSFSNIVVDGATRAATANDRDQTKGNNGVLFDLASILGDEVPARNCLYYFEIPVNEGEYALGSVYNSSYQGSYLLYLDLAANAGNEFKFTAYSITTKRTGHYYPVGVDFAVVDVGTGGGDSFGVNIASNNSGSISFAVAANNVNVTGTQSLAGYTFHGSKYRSSSPGNSAFNVTGNALGAITDPLVGTGERILTIKRAPTEEGGTMKTATVIDHISYANGAATIDSSEYSIDGVASTEFAVTSLLSATIDLNTKLRNLKIAAVLTSDSAAHQFTTVYDEEHCEYGNRVIDVDITLNGAVIDVAVTTTPNAYTLKIGGAVYANGSTYPSS